MNALSPKIDRQKQKGKKEKRGELHDNWHESIKCCKFGEI